MNFELGRWCPGTAPLNLVSHSQVVETRMGQPMKTLMKYAVSLFKHHFRLVANSSYESSGDVIISGYSTSQDNEKPCALGRKPVGILYADIAEYARLTEEDEEGTHLRLVESMGIVKAHIAASNGRVAHSAGDAILAEFVDADSALHCAINVQLATRQWNANFDLAQQVRFRIGVNFGEVISDQGDIYGKAVNLTARLECLASSGGICVSDTVRSELGNSSAFKFVPMGQQYVKNISEPVQAFWIEIDAEQIVDVDLTSAVRVAS